MIKHDKDIQNLANRVKKLEESIATYDVLIRERLNAQHIERISICHPEIAEKLYLQIADMKFESICGIAEYIKIFAANEWSTLKQSNTDN